MAGSVLSTGQHGKIEMSPGAAAAKEPPKRCQWNEAMEDVHLDFLIRETEQGKHAGDSFRAKTWEDTVPGVNAVNVRAVKRHKFSNSANLFP